jgi:heme-degrading monooxygenase HmoA
MIIRVFRPTVHPGKEREFEAFLRDTAAPLVSRQSGLLAQHVGRPRDPSSTEYVYVTVWEDVESIRAFAGERWLEAVITPDEEHLLKETWIGHYEALAVGEGDEISRWRCCDRGRPRAPGGCWRRGWPVDPPRR